ncbi:hypothetical protein BB559_000522 [Furculomyces boomerangus]|uniref:Mitochondrial dicarboxylate transporter n=2 Tax=Harpellales TaxID=61421 RepID=A0A2T9Z546_9FUNG|nr:hypothetical protein BB559_000522 [Furculomyces boomerangus]PVZ97676.1 hypothetical protein BB558_006345 [Smittium angustum]PWA00971.1 hypothetical protein BB558_002947 [Smittium angustum]
MATPKNIQTPFYLGGLASCTGALFTHPMDLLKVRLQTTKQANASVTSVIKQIYQTQGVSGYYRGLSAALLRQATYSTFRFAVYEIVREKFKRKDGTVSAAGSIFSGVVGGAVGGLFGNPADVANVRMQNDGSLAPELRRNYKNVFDALFRMVREEGPMSLLSGAVPNVSRGVLMTASQVGSYDIFKDALVSYGMSASSPVTHFSSSVLAALIATTVCSPIDVAKTRIMNSKSKEYKNLADALITMTRTEGVSALFKGWTPSFLRLGPHTILVFLFLEQFKAAYIRYKTPDYAKL